MSRRAHLDEDTGTGFVALATVRAANPRTPALLGPRRAVAEQFDMSRIAVQKHLATLEEADLVISERQGRERRLWFNSVPLQLVHERWSEQYRAFWANRLTQLKYASEQGER